MSPGWDWVVELQRRFSGTENQANVMAMSCPFSLAGVARRCVGESGGGGCEPLRRSEETVTVPGCLAATSFSSGLGCRSWLTQDHAVVDRREVNPM